MELERLPRFTDESAVKVATVETPTHLLGWLPLVWTRVLFPGTAPTPSSWQWRPFAILFILSAILLYPWMTFHLFEPDEGRYAQIPREMLERGAWLVPTLLREPYLDKPPLFYWLVMLAYSLFGYHEWAARLVPALAVQATVLLVYALGQRPLGERAAFWGTMLLMVSPMFLGVGRLLVLDGLLTLWVTLALLAYLRGAAHEVSGVNVPPLTSCAAPWWIVSAVACGLGVLTKGPVALLLVVPPLVAHRWLSAQPRISCAAWLGFLTIVLAINLPWYVAVCVQQPEFARYFLLQHNVQRFVEPFDHVQPVWYYVPIVFYGLLPGILLAWPLLRFMTSSDAADSQRRCSSMGYLLLAGLWCVGFFSLAGSKLPTYVLPAFPPLCLAIGCFIARTDWHRSRWAIGLLTFGWCIQMLANSVIVPVYARHRSPVADASVVERCADLPVVCFPRHVDSVAFATGRDDFRVFRSKNIASLMQELDRQPRTVVLFGHRNSAETLRLNLPAHLQMIERRPMGVCESALVVRVK